MLLTTDPQEFFHGMSSLLQAVLVLPIIAICAATFGLVNSFNGIKGKYSVIPFITVIAFSAWLWQWNLLGWHLN